MFDARDLLRDPYGVEPDEAHDGDYEALVTIAELLALLGCEP